MYGMQTNNYAIKCVGLVLGTLLAIANLHAQIPGWGEEPTGEPDVHYYPFYDGVQMIEFDYLSAYQRKIGYLEQAKPRALTYEMILGPPEPNVYVFRDRNGKIVRQYGELPKDIELLPVYRSASETKPHNHFQARLGGSHILSPFPTRYFPYYLTGARTHSHENPSRLGLIDSLGNRVLEEKYQEIIKERSSDQFITIKGNTYELRDLQMNVLFRTDEYHLQPSLQNPGYVDASKNDKWGLLDAQGKWVIPCKYYDMIRAFNEYGLAQVRTSGGYGFVNKEGKEVIKCKYQGTSEFGNGLIGVRINGKWGFLDTSGKMVIAPQYTLISKFSDGLARVANKIDGRYYFGYIDQEGNEVIPLIYANATHFTNGRAKVRTDFPDSPNELRIPHTPEDQKRCKGKWITIGKDGAVHE